MIYGEIFNACANKAITDEKKYYASDIKYLLFKSEEILVDI